MDVELSENECNLILLALWQTKLSLGKPLEDSLGLPIETAVDRVAYKLGGRPGVFYGLPEAPDSLDSI
jgi:hypothetical protein